MDLRAQLAAGWVHVRTSGRRLALGLGVCAATIEAAFLSVSGLVRPSEHIPEYISYYLLASIGYVFACWLVTRRQGVLRQASALRWIWIAALAFRLTVLAIQPGLSEDVARYRWQGMLQHQGGDPYTATPKDPAWEALRDETWPRIAGKNLPSAYGPVVEQVNRWYYEFVVRHEPDPWQQVWLFKLPFALADLAVGLALVRFLASIGRPPAWALIYLWSPLSVTEFWMEGHNDSIAVFFVLVALTLQAKQRRTWALVALTAATMCKFWPAVLFPFLLASRQDGRWRIQGGRAVVSLAVGTLLCLPYWGSIASVLTTLGGFAGGWRNNESLFAGFLGLAGGDMAVAAYLSWSTLLLVVLVLRWLRLEAGKGELGAICALLLLAANCFPWYLTWMLPLVAAHPSAPLILWTSLVALAYHVIPAYEATGAWTYDPMLTGLEYGPVLAWIAVVAIRQGLRSTREAKWPDRLRRGRVRQLPGAR